MDIRFKENILIAKFTDPESLSNKVGLGGNARVRMGRRDQVGEKQILEEMTGIWGHFRKM